MSRRTSPSSKRAKAATVALLAAATTVLGPLSSAVADPGPSRPAASVTGDADLVRRQAPMLTLADELEAAGKTGSGFAGVALDVPAGVVHLYWKGTAPRAVEVATAKAPAGVRVEVHPAAHSAEELRERADAIIRKHGLSTGGDVHRVTPLEDGSGLELGVVRTPGTPVTRAAAEPLVTRTEVEEPVAPYDGRRGGGSPFEGGIRINGCSAAFTAVALPEGPGGPETEKLLGAAHCVDYVGQLVYTGNVLVGHVEAVNPELDTSLIAVAPGTSITGWMWDGGVGDGSEFTKPVQGTSAPRKGTLVCTSGAASGVHCDIKISKTGSTLDWGTHVSRAVSIGDQLQGELAAGDGDSGGPVFTLESNFSSVLAAGVIIGGDPKRPATCTYLSTECSTRVFFTDFRAVQSHWAPLYIMAG
ncbi:hypothetical protein ACSDR0_41730 [Streptosporangium sp. G11]|uniref:hypothetical protein n=1 Tax=Streptosporangium sp. G11 TaxID=3436926 RepID=UPI003EB83C56